MTPAQLRRQQQALTRLAANDLAALWRQVTNAAEANRALRDVLPALIDTYGQAAAAVAANWYDEARLAADASGAFTAIPADIAKSGAEELAAWATAKGSDLVSIQALAEGGMGRRIMNFGRGTIMGSAMADPRSDGWQRAGVGECSFCSLLIGRGSVYSEATANFASHDNCSCVALPAFKGKPVPVKKYTVGPRRKLDADGKPIPDADFERAKAYIATH